MRSICICSGIEYSGCESFKMGSAVLKFADAQESIFQVAKRSNVVSTIMKGLRFVDSQEWRFQASKLSSMCSCVLVDG